MIHDMGSGNIKRVNKDDLRAMLDDGNWSSANEKFLLGVRDYIVTNALNAGKHVIVDDTNLKPAHETRLREIAKANGADFEVIDFTGVGVEECVERDRKRPNYVGERVIRDMAAQFLSTGAIAPGHDSTLPDVILVDVDGTVAKMNGRGPFEWDRVKEDLPRRAVIRAVIGYGKPWIFVSGRDEVCRNDTRVWLEGYFGGAEHLFMRPLGDMRKDAVVKKELYEQHIKGKYNVLAIFDDRPQMIRAWRELGFGDRLFDVGDGREF